MHGHPFLMEENKMMKFDKKKLSQEQRNKIAEILTSTEDKTEAILQAMELFSEATNEELIQSVLVEAEKAKADSSFKEKLGLRVLSKKEKDFYELLKNPKQAITGDQIVIIPNEIVDHTLDNVKNQSSIASRLIKFAPANVKKWIVAEKTGKVTWGSLVAEFTNEMSASFDDLNIELGKMYAYIVIPKAIRDLSNEFVDRYLLAILNEAMNDGVDEAYIDGTGVEMPTGVLRSVKTKNSDGTAKAKTVLTTIKNFSPKQLAPVKKTLSNNGLRIIGTLFLIANPSDVYEFVEPALYGETYSGGYEQKSATKIEIIECTSCPTGKAIFTIADAYTMGFSGIQVHEFKETLADKDANLLIAKAYGNGRATDDNTAVVFDVTKLEEYIPSYKNVTPSVDPAA